MSTKLTNKYIYSFILIHLLCLATFAQEQIQDNPQVQLPQSLSGLIKDQHGKVSVGAKVTIKDLTTNQDITVTTDKDGQFQIPDFHPEGKFRVTITQPSSPTTKHKVLLKGNISVDPDKVLGLISGTVIDDKGNSVPNANITALDLLSSQVKTAQTDPEGKFIFSNTQLSGKTKYSLSGLENSIIKPYIFSQDYVLVDPNDDVTWVGGSSFASKPGGKKSEAKQKIEVEIIKISEEQELENLLTEQLKKGKLLVHTQLGCNPGESLFFFLTEQNTKNKSYMVLTTTSPNLELAGKHKTNKNDYLFIYYGRK